MPLGDEARWGADDPELAAHIVRLAEAGMLTADPHAEAYIRELMDLPEHPKTEDGPSTLAAIWLLLRLIVVIEGGFIILGVAAHVSWWLLRLGWSL